VAEKLGASSTCPSAAPRVRVGRRPDTAAAVTAATAAAEARVRTPPLLPSPAQPDQWSGVAADTTAPPWRQRRADGRWLTDGEEAGGLPNAGPQARARTERVGGGSGVGAGFGRACLCLAGEWREVVNPHARHCPAAPGVSGGVGRGRRRDWRRAGCAADRAGPGVSRRAGRCRRTDSDAGCGNGRGNGRRRCCRLGRCCSLLQTQPLELHEFCRGGRAWARILCSCGCCGCCGCCRQQGARIQPDSENHTAALGELDGRALVPVSKSLA
jgi:hypothetical protein